MNRHRRSGIRVKEYGVKQQLSSVGNVILPRWIKGNLSFCIASLRNVYGCGVIPLLDCSESYINAIKSDFSCTNERNKGEGPVNLWFRSALLYSG